MKKLSTIIMLLSFVLVFGLVSCDSTGNSGGAGNNTEKTENPQEIQSSDLMNDIAAQPVNAKGLDDQFRSAAAKFSLDLYKASISNSGNSLISPASVLLALAMTANGADGNTLSQMEQVLGGGMPINSLNEYLFSFVQNLNSQPKERISISNSIWFRNSGLLAFTPNRDFLQTNADYYSADAFAAPFDDQTVNDINTWINNATDGLIKEMLDNIPPDAVIYLINTVLFDAEWKYIYKTNDVRGGEFTAYNNQKQPATFMHSSENKFISDDKAIGFIRPYHSERYSFAAILPVEDIDIFDYIAALSGEDFLKLIGNARSARVTAALPKFGYEYKISMNDALKAMGMEEAFSMERADLSRMGSGNLFISKVEHKAYIDVDERGTKAGAATVVEVGTTSVPPPPIPVILDRPFIYAIIDNATNLPLFIGTLLLIP